MFCTDKEWKHCQEEKRGCSNCFYEEDWKDIRGTKEQISKISIENGKKACKPILQFDKNGKFIKEWESQSEAARKLKIQRTSIGNCLNCKNKRKTAGGYVWKFKEDL